MKKLLCYFMIACIIVCLVSLDAIISYKHSWTLTVSLIMIMFHLAGYVVSRTYWLIAHESARDTDRINPNDLATMPDEMHNPNDPGLCPKGFDREH